jgi:hypothetical protein
VTKKNQALAKAEAFVRRVLAKSFNQKVDADTLRAVAEKVSQAVDVSTSQTVSTSKAVSTSKKAA